MLPTPATGRWDSSWVLRRWSLRRSAGPERPAGEGGVEGLGAQGVQRGQRGVARRRATTAMRPKRRVSSKRSMRRRRSATRPGWTVRLLPAASPRASTEGPGHAQVDDQLAAVVEAEQQVLAPPADRVDRGADGRGGLVELGREGMSAAVDDGGARRPAVRQLAADRLDLGQLGHGEARRAGGGAAAGSPASAATPMAEAPRPAPPAGGRPGRAGAWVSCSMIEMARGPSGTIAVHIR